MKSVSSHIRNASSKPSCRATSIRSIVQLGSVQAPAHMAASESGNTNHEWSNRNWPVSSFCHSALATARSAPLERSTAS